MKEENILKIKRLKPYKVRDGRQVRVSEETYEKVKELAYEACAVEEDSTTVKELAEYLGLTTRTVWDRIKEHKGFKTEKIAGQKESKITLIKYL